jgi:hypothetical protein
LAIGGKPSFCNLPLRLRYKLEKYFCWQGTWFRTKTRLSGINRMKKSIEILVKALNFFLDFMLRKCNLLLKGSDFVGSKKYWEYRYKAGGTSGSGSYGKLAMFKKQVINNFVKQHNIQSVTEFGCGDGNQLRLAEYPFYIGLDVSDTVLERCREKFKGDLTKNFFNLNDAGILRSLTSELTLSLDVIYHLVEDKIFTSHMDILFKSSTKYVIIYSSNFDGHHNQHERTRNFSRWIEENCKEWSLQEKIVNKFPYNCQQEDESSQSDFNIYSKIG